MLPSSSTATTESKLLSYYNFSTTPQLQESIEAEEKRVLVMPPNLKIDPRCVSSPFYGLEQIEKLQTERNNDANDVNDDQGGESQGVLYDLANAREPTYAIPLPDRLHVPIVQLSSTNNTGDEADNNEGAEEVGTIHLSSDVFGQDPIRVDILHRCVVYQRNKKRGLRNNGARTKTISEVSGSGRKVRPQKGGGTARAGHSRPPHWRGGAKAHGPKGMIQNYETKLNKKVRRLAVKIALSQKLKEGNLILIDGFDNLDSFKTKTLANALENVGDIGGRYGCTAYLVDHTLDESSEEEEEGETEEGSITSVGGVHVNLKVASRNLHKIKVTNQKFLNVYDILKYEKLVMSLSAFQAIEERMCDE